ncbi:hypothetical protein SAMN02910456_01962 [Ruminococcaceae bacterium YRB3002]|nr:hypothetical protein SAMN02910456_01962 [Ruminococcaceae bacterium YRB3002]
MTNAKKDVTPSYGSIFKAIEGKAAGTKFGNGFVATQITLTGECDYQPLYIKVDDGAVVTEPYEYHDSNFFIDADAQAMADILNGVKNIYECIENGTVVVNGEVGKALVFIHTFFG